MPTKLTDDQVLEVCRLRLAGGTLDQLAARFGVHRMCIQYIVKGWTRAGTHPDHPDHVACVALEQAALARRRARRIKLRTRLYDAAIADYRRGYGLREAARRNRCTFTKLAKEMRRRGIKRRPPGKPAPVFYRTAGRP